MRALVISMLAAAAITACAAEAAACTCAEPGPACVEYWKASAVFAGRVESIGGQRSGKMVPALAMQRVRFAVSEPFTGVTGKTVEVTTARGGQSCGYPFRQDAEYLVYARRDEGTGDLVVTLCSPTQELSRAADDLTYLRRIAAGEVIPARISGEVLLGSRRLEPVQTPLRDPRPLAGIGIALGRSGQTVRVVTGDDGRFAAEGLSAGRYDVAPELSEGLYAEGWPRTIDLPGTSSCEVLHVMVFADGRVAGRIVDAAGRPVAGLTVELTVPAGVDEAPGPVRLRDLTDGDGRYEIVHVPEGRFVVGINTRPAPDGAPPEPRLFHPGVPSAARSTRVMLRAGERVTLPDFVLPPDVTYVTLAGVVVDAGGTPAAYAKVYLKGLEDSGFILSEPAVTDASGRFMLAAISGRTYRLFAERARTDTGVTRVDSSDQVPLTATSGAPPLTLTLRRRY
jgi:5-hydroxyisourate hydrolase-like protein (transthyretin family)